MPRRQIEAVPAGRGIGRHHALADAEFRDILADRDDIAGQFVPEHGGGHDHAGVVSAAEHLHVGAAGQRHLHAYQDVAASIVGTATGSTCKCSLP